MQTVSKGNSSLSTKVDRVAKELPMGGTIAALRIIPRSPTARTVGPKNLLDRLETDPLSSTTITTLSAVVSGFPL